jgi:hypothetical protein
MGNGWTVFALLNQLKRTAMSLLFDPCIERIAKGKASGDHLVELFEILASDAENLDEPTLSLAVCYLDSDDDFPMEVEGKYVPELHLVVRRIEPDEIEDSNE